MIDALIAGRLHGQATKRTGSNGRAFYTAKVRTPTPKDGEAIFVNCIAFNTTVGEALLALQDGDAVALTGELTPKAWTDREGNAKPALDLVAHALVTAYQVTRKRKAVTEAGAQEEAPF